MSRYTLRSFAGHKQIEQFDHRSADKLKSILNHPRNHRAGESGPFGEAVDHPTRFEIFDSQREKLFDGRVADALSFVRSLK